MIADTWTVMWKEWKELLLLWVPVFGGQALPEELRARLRDAMMAADVTAVVIVVAGVLALLDIALLAAAMARFQRARLILD